MDEIKSSGVVDVQGKQNYILVNTQDGVVDLSLFPSDRNAVANVKRLGPHDVQLEGDGKTSVEYIAGFDLSSWVPDEGDSKHAILTRSGEAVTLAYAPGYDSWLIF